MPGNEFLSREVLGHGAYLCARAADAHDLCRAGLELIVLQAQVVIHVSSRQPEVVDDFCGEAMRGLSAAGPVRLLRGSVRARNYTGAAMDRCAYERAAAQRSLQSHISEDMKRKSAARPNCCFWARGV